MAGGADRDWFAHLDAGVDWMKSTGLAVQFDGGDLIHITGIDSKSGLAEVTVFASTASDAPVIFRGEVNVAAHLA